MDAVRKMTLMPADRLGMPAKGRIAIGADADLTMFDAGTRDRSRDVRESGAILGGYPVRDRRRHRGGESRRAGSQRDSGTRSAPLSAMPIPLGARASRRTTTNATWPPPASRRPTPSCSRNSSAIVPRPWMRRSGSRARARGSSSIIFRRRRWRAYRVTCTDINPAYLERLAARFPCATAIDDIECPALPGPFDLAIVILVLEHVDWRRAVAGLCGPRRRVFAVIQQESGRPGRAAAGGNMAVLDEHPTRLVDRDQLIAEFAARSFELTRTATRDGPRRQENGGAGFQTPAITLRRSRTVTSRHWPARQPDSLARPQQPEAALFVEPQARLILREDAGLQGPDPGGLGRSDQFAQESKCPRPAPRACCDT